MKTITLNQLKTMGLPSRLYQFIALAGIERQLSINTEEWSRLNLLYRAMRAAWDNEEVFPALAQDFLRLIDLYSNTKTGHSVRKDKQRPTRNQRKQTNQKKQKKESLGKALRAAKPTTKELITERKQAPSIGLGIESKLPLPPRARREDIKIDANTRSDAPRHPYHALYTAGWSLNTDE